MVSTRKPAVNWLNSYNTQSDCSKALRASIKLSAELAGVTLDQIALAVSGGPDSAALAIEAAVLSNETGLAPHIFHVHHGLQSPANKWQQQVHDLAYILRLPCHSVRTLVKSGTGKGTEAAARDARYKALISLANELNIKHIMLAHHMDDQAETVLLRLLRGTGSTGLSAMAASATRGGIHFLRPWLNISRSAIMQQVQEFLMASQWATVYDPTNYDHQYTRSALREMLTPALNKRWPRWQSILARHALLAQQTTELLDELGQSDLQQLDPCTDGLSFCLKKWRALSAARQAHVIRYWLAQNGIHAPTQARLDNLQRQLQNLHALGHDRQMRVRHAGIWITCFRGRVQLELE